MSFHQHNLKALIEGHLYSFMDQSASQLTSLIFASDKEALNLKTPMIIR